MYLNWLDIQFAYLQVLSIMLNTAIYWPDVRLILDRSPCYARKFQAIMSPHLTSKEWNPYAFLGSKREGLEDIQRLLLSHESNLCPALHTFLPSYFS